MVISFVASALAAVLFAVVACSCGYGVPAASSEPSTRFAGTSSSQPMEATATIVPSPPSAEVPPEDSEFEPRSPEATEHGSGGGSDVSIPRVRMERPLGQDAAASVTWNESSVLGDLVMPINGACLPETVSLLPNAPRKYRAGIHEGIDFYDGYVCAPIKKGTEVVAVGPGVVIRADNEFVEMTIEEVGQLMGRSQEAGYTEEEDLDRFRGRQVWVDHGEGIVSRYAHLMTVASGIELGKEVEVGEVLGTVGNSGTPDGVRDPDADIHLHFEIRIGQSYLGEGLVYKELLAELNRVFADLP